MLSAQKDSVQERWCQRLFPESCKASGNFHHVPSQMPSQKCLSGTKIGETNPYRIPVDQVRRSAQCCCGKDLWDVWASGPRSTGSLKAFCRHLSPGKLKPGCNWGDANGLHQFPQQPPMNYDWCSGQGRMKTIHPAWILTKNPPEKQLLLLHLLVNQGLLMKCQKTTGTKRRESGASSSGEHSADGHLWMLHALITRTTYEYRN